MRSSRSRALAAALAFVAAAVVLVPRPAAGEPAAAGASKPKPEKEHDPANIVAISRSMAAIAKGHERFAAKDTTGAVDAYKKAAELSPKDPRAPYLLAEAYLVSGNEAEAEAALQRAYEMETKDARLRAHVLFLRADLLERQKKWEPAKAAWQAYLEHAAKAGDAAHPQSGAARLKAVDAILALEKAYPGVRERIAAEKAAADAKKKGAKPAKKK